MIASFLIEREEKESIDDKWEMLGLVDWDNNGATDKYKDFKEELLLRREAHSRQAVFKLLLGQPGAKDVSFCRINMNVRENGLFWKRKATTV